MFRWFDKLTITTNGVFAVGVGLWVITHTLFQLFLNPYLGLPISLHSSVLVSRGSSVSVVLPSAISLHYSSILPIIPLHLEYLMGLPSTEPQNPGLSPGVKKVGRQGRYQKDRQLYHWLPENPWQWWLVLRQQRIPALRVLLPFVSRSLSTHTLTVLVFPSPFTLQPLSCFPLPSASDDSSSRPKPIP